MSKTQPQSLYYIRTARFPWRPWLIAAGVVVAGLAVFLGAPWLAGAL